MADKRLLCAVLALVFCVTVFAFPAAADNNAKSTPDSVVRVGMYIDFPSIDTRRFASYNRASGFTFGYSLGRSFCPLFSVSQRGLVVLPQVNALLDIASESKKCTPGNGNIGCYSVIQGVYSSASDAFGASKAFSNGFVAVTDTGFELRTGGYSSFDAARKASGGKPVASPVSGGLTVVDAETGKIVLMYERSTHPFALKDGSDGAVQLPMLHRSGSVNNFSYPGFFEYAVSDNKLIMVNCVELETYTKCVMANEIGIGFSTETRKAFAVLARTVPMGKKHSAQGCDVCNASCCQVYYGIYRMGEENNAIVDSTRGQYLTYEGDPIAVLYHGSNGGASCSSVAAWGGTEVPYLKSVFLDGEETGEDTKWKLVFEKEDFYEYLKSRKAFSSLSDDEISMSILGTDPYGSDYVTVLSVSDGSGNSVEVVNSEKVRVALGFDSANFKISFAAEQSVLTKEGVADASVSGILTADGYKPFSGFGESYPTVDGTTVAPSEVVIDGAGSGHGVGFSAAGSETLAKQGYSYKYILEFFFNQTEILLMP